MDLNFATDSEDENSDRVLLNIGGVKFETYTATLQNISDTRLAWLTGNVDGETLKNKEFFFDRHPGVFIHILNYYRTGKLHAPTDVCGPLVEEELQFWGIDEKQMEPCCWETYTKHREAEFNLKSFEGPGFEDLKVESTRRVSTLSSRGVTRWRLYFDQIWAILDQPHSSPLAKKFSLLSCLAIVISVSLYCLDTMPVLQNKPAWEKLHAWINHVCLAFFTFEFITRITVTPDKRHFLQQSMNWIDFFSLVPSFLMLFLPVHWIQNLVIIRLLRIFRFFKLSYGLQVLLHTLKASSYELTLLLLILLIPVVIFSSLVYFVEYGYGRSNSKFGSIPTTFWWCLITMTTVGYGDLVPITWAGQVIGSVCAISGLLIVALPISVIGSNFTLYYAHVRARLKLPRKNRTLLQGNLRGLLKQPLSLSSRDRDRKTIKRNKNHAIRRKNDSPVSQDSVKMQARRMKAFDEISRQTESRFASLDKLDKEDTASTPVQTAPTRVRRKAVAQLVRDVSESFDCESVEVRSLINEKEEELCSTVAERCSVIENESDLKEAKKNETIAVETEYAEEKLETVIDIAMEGIPCSKTRMSSRKASLKEAMNSDRLDDAGEKAHNRKRAASLTESEKEKSKDKINRYQVKRIHSLRLPPTQRLPDGLDRDDPLRSPKSPLLNISKPKKINATVPQEKCNQPIRRARRGALANQILSSDSDKSEGEIFLLTPQKFFPSSQNLAPATSAERVSKQQLCKSYSESQAYFSKTKPAIDFKLEVRTPTPTLASEGINLHLNPLTDSQQNSEAPLDHNVLIQVETAKNVLETSRTGLCNGKSNGRNGFLERSPKHAGNLLKDNNHNVDNSTIMRLVSHRQLDDDGFFSTKRFSDTTGHNMAASRNQMSPKSRPDFIAPNAHRKLTGDLTHGLSRPKDSLPSAFPFEEPSELKRASSDADVMIKQKISFYEAKQNDLKESGV